MDYGIYSLGAILLFGGTLTMLMPEITAGYKYQTAAKATEAKA
jgi:hypothetical protein